MTPMSDADRVKAQEILNRLASGDAQRITERLMQASPRAKHEFDTQLQSLAKSKSQYKAKRGLSSEEGTSRFNVYLDAELDNQLSRFLENLEDEEGVKLNKSILLNLAAAVYLQRCENLSQSAIQDAIRLGYLIKVR